MTADFAGNQLIIEVLYLIASVLFILSLKWMSSPTSARHGIWAGEAGMLLAICGTLLHHGIVDYRLIAIALVLGTITLLARSASRWSDRPSSTCKRPKSLPS